MQVAILAGGLATRIRPLTSSVPKSLIEIGGKPFIEYQLDFLQKQGITNIILCVGYLGEQLENHLGDGRKFGVNLRYSYESEHLLGTAGAIKNAENLLDEQFFVMYGDSYLFLDFAEALSFFNRCYKLGLMVVYRNYDKYDRSNVIFEGNLVKAYSKQYKTNEMIYIDYGISVLSKKALDLVPSNQFSSLEELFALLVKQEELLAYEVNERFYEIGSPKGINEFKKYISGKE